jgi:hypothetical protein
MPDQIESAASGRAKCRGCGRTVAKGELRFGEALPNPYGEGEALFWFHLRCAACMRPERLLPALAQSLQPIEERAELERVAQLGLAHERLPRLASAERAPTNRARCRHCQELIEKSAWRLGLQAFEEGRFTSIGFIHAGCASGYFGTTQILDRIAWLAPALAPSDVAELETLLSAAARSLPDA